MSVHKPTYEELVNKIYAVNPLLVAAIDDVDETLIEEFQKLSINERIRRASQGAQTLCAFDKP